MSLRVIKSLLVISLMTIFIEGHADELEGKLSRIGARLDSASALFASENGMNMTELSKLAVELEGIMIEMREVERVYGAERATVEAKFRDESKGLSEILGYMATLQAANAPDYLLHPEGAIGAIHANILVESVLPQLELQLNDIAIDLEYWRSITNKQAQLSQTSVLAVNEINKVRKTLVEMKRSDAPQVKIQDAKVLDALFAVSDNLADFTREMAKIPAESPQNANEPIENSMENLEWPAKGKHKAVRSGVQISTTQSAITTPVAGTVRFAKNFLDYGNMIILEPKKGYLMVLAGFDDMVVTEGEIVKKGDVLGFFAINAQKNTQEPLENNLHDLYIELRENGNALDLAEYFRTDDK